MKFYGVIGFWVRSVEEKPGIWKNCIVEKPYVGDVNRNVSKFQSGENQNDDLAINNQISIIADLYARTNMHAIRYVIWNGVKWKVSNVTINYPRLLLELGGVYNGPDKIMST